MHSIKCALFFACIIAFATAAELLSENEPQVFTVNAGRSSLFYLRGRPGQSGAIKINWTGASATGATLYASAGSIQDSNAFEVSGEVEYRLASGAEDNVDWFFVITAGSSIAKGTLTVQFIPTVELTSGQLTNFNVAFRSYQLYRLTNAASATVSFTSDNQDLELFAAAGVVPTLSTAVLNNTHIWRQGTDQEDLLFVFHDSQGNSNSVGNITVTRDTTTTLTAGQQMTVTLPANSYAPYVLPAKTNENGLVRVESDNADVTVHYIPNRGQNGQPWGTASNNTWLPSEYTDNLDWFFVVENPSGSSVNFHFTVYTVSTQTITSGTQVTAQFSSVHDAKLYKLNAVENRGAAILAQYDDTNLQVYASQTFVYVSSQADSGVWSLGATDNLDWWVAVYPDSDELTVPFNVTSLETISLSDGKNTTYTVKADDIAVFKLNSPTKSTVIRVSVESEATGVSVNANPTTLGTHATATAGTPIWATQDVNQIPSDTEVWWFWTRAGSSDQTATITVNEIGTKPLTSGVTDASQLESNEVRVLKLNAQNNQGGIIRASWSVDGSTSFSISDTFISHPAMETSPTFIKSSTTDNVNWFVYLKNPAVDSVDYNVTVTLVPTIVITAAKPSTFDLADRDWALARYNEEDTELGSTGILSVTYLAGTSGKIASVDAGTTVIPAANRNIPAQSTPYDIAAINSVQVNNTWWFFIEAGSGAVTGASIQVQPFATNFFCDPAVNCFGRGTCATNGRKCNCEEGSGGTFCGCDPAVNCSGHGKCTPDGNSCVCDAFRVGPDCSQNGGSFLAPSAVLLLLFLGAFAF